MERSHEDISHKPLMIIDISTPARVHGLVPLVYIIGSRPTKIMAQDRSQSIVYSNKETIM
jgi:hypothetical protein